MSDDGQFGFSIIVLLGSVFSPYYAWAGRRDPLNHAAFNVGLYGRGVKRWTMTERGRSAVRRSQDSITIGPSSLEWDGDDLVVNICEWGVPIPRRVVGTIRLTPRGRTRSAHQLDYNGKHFWQPIAPSARAQVEFSSPGLDWSGDAYFDSNWGAEPLEDGFQSWDWCRASLPDGAGIYYDAIVKNGDKRRLALRYDHSGSVKEVECPPAATLNPGPIWRVPRSVPAMAKGDAKTLQMLEDTPFYTRSRILAKFEEETATAVHESLDLTKFSKQWVRCLLPFRMPRVSR